MKPRLESQQLTIEDWFARGWLYAARPPRPWRGRLQDVAFEQDRRDADLMYLAQLWRRGQMVMDHTYAHSGPCGRFAIDGIRCGGNAL